MYTLYRIILSEICPLSSLPDSLRFPPLFWECSEHTHYLLPKCSEHSWNRGGNHNESGRLESGQISNKIIPSKKTLDICGKPGPCFVHLSEAKQIVDHQEEINQNNLDIEILQTEKETADILHPFYLTQKCQLLQEMNRHLDAVLKEKRALRQRLMKPLCQDSVPIEAVFHRYAVELLAQAVAVIEKLETHLITVRNIPQIPLTMKNMDSALTKMDLLVTETEELAEQILKWREKQKGIFCYNSQLTLESDSFFRNVTPH